MTSSDCNNQFAPFHIGHLIEDELKRQNKSISWLARQINCDRRNIYDIFTRKSIDTALLCKISCALGCDFFALFSRALDAPDDNPLTNLDNQSL